MRTFSNYYTHNYKHDLCAIKYIHENELISWDNVNNKTWVCTSQEIGEEFVEFLEKELNISDQEVDPNNNYEGYQRSNSFESSRTERTETYVRNEEGKVSSIEENLDEIEATLAKLKRELGL